MAGMGTEVGRISIKVVPDMTGFRQKVKAVLESIGDADIEVNAKGTAAAAAEIDAVADDRTATIEVDVDRTGVQRFKDWVKGTFSKEKVKVGTEVDQQAAEKTKRDIAALLPGGKDISNFKPSFGTGINAAGAVAIVAGITAVAGPLLGLISAALASIPGLIATVATPIAALTLGMDGLKEAAKSLAQPFADLKTSMSGAVKDQFTPLFDRLGKVFPMLQASLPTVTKGLANMASGVVDAVTSAPGMAKIEATIRNIGAALSSMRPGMTGFTDGLIGLAEQFSLKLPAITDWINKAGKGFGEWVQKITENGDLGRAFDGLGGSLKIVADLIGDIGKKGIEFFNNPQGINSFNDGLKSVADTLRDIQNISNGLSNFVDLFDNMLPRLDPSAIADDFKNVFKGSPLEKFLTGETMFGGGKEIIDEGAAKRSMRESLANMFGVDQHDVVMNAGTEMGQQFISSLQGAMTGGAGAAPDLTSTIFSGFDKSALTQPASEAGGAFIESLTAGITGAAAAAPPLAPVQQSITTGAEAIATAVEDIKPVVAPPDTAQAEAKVTEYQTFIDSVTQQVRGSLSQATSGESLPAPDFSTFKAAWAEIPTFITTQLSGIGAAVSSIGSQISSAMSVGMSGVINIVNATFQGVQQAATTGMQGMVAAVQAGVQQAIAAIQTLPAAIGAIGAQLFAASQAAGAQVGAGMAAGITASIGQAVAAAQSLAAAVTAAAAVKLDIQSPSGVFKDIGLNVTQGFVNGLDEGKQSVIDRATALAEAISEAMKGGIEMPDFKDQLKETMAALELQKKSLKVELDAVPKEDKAQKENLRGQMKELQNIKDILSLQKEQLGYSKEYGNQTQKTDDIVGNTLDSLLSAGKDIGMGVYKQFAGDLGIGGQGAISQGLEQGIGFGMQMLSSLITGGMGGGTTINVGSVDDALAVKRVEDNRQSMQLAGR
jgi:hypothetical protein